MLTASLRRARDRGPVRPSHLTARELEELLTHSHDYMWRVSAETSVLGEGWRCYNSPSPGLRRWWGLEAGLDEDEAQRLRQLRKHVNDILQERGLAQRDGRAPNKLHLSPPPNSGGSDGARAPGSSAEVEATHTPAFADDLGDGAASDRGRSHKAARLDWKREEVILAMDLYVAAGALSGGSIPGKRSPQVLALSRVLKELSAYPKTQQGETYRNPDGVYLKLTNLRAVETEGEHGMTSYGQQDAAVWREYIHDLPGLHAEAAVLRARLSEGVVTPASALPSSEDVDVENQHTEWYAVHASNSVRQAERAEQKLVQRYKRYMEAKGVSVCRRKYRPAGEVRPIFSDVWVPERKALIEAKNSDGRDALRLAIGQLFDYRRFHEDSVVLAVLLPYPPSAERLDLLRSAGIQALWPHGAGFRDSARGVLV